MQQSRVTVKFRGRMGNCLFRYCAARLFSERHGFHFTERVTSLWPFRTDHHDEPQQPFVTLTDKADLLTMHAATGVNYHLDGWFQRNVYYMPERERIRAWFKPFLADLWRNDDDIVMHIRLDDYRVWPGYSRVIDHSWYLQILGAVKFGRLHIVAEQLDEKYLHPFRKFVPVIVHSDSALDDWNYLRRFSRMIMSNSTFAWWAWFLGNGVTAYLFKPWVSDPQIQLTEWPGSFVTVDGRYEGTV